MSSIEETVAYRTKLLNLIEECNTKLGFSGNRGEQYFNDMELEHLAEDLISQLPKEKEVNNETANEGTAEEIPAPLQPGEKETERGPDNSEVL